MEECFEFDLQRPRKSLITNFTFKITFSILFPFLYPVEEEFLSVAEELKPFAEQRMNLEPFSWLKDYSIDMDELYTELTLERLNNTKFGERGKILQNYTDMFKHDSKSPKGRKKVLMKGEAGMGKTSLGKKMGFDWVKGVFKMFSIIFFLTLRLMNPDDSIESVIMEQHPELEGLKMSKQKVGAILNKFGDRCLLILDGLDEHGQGQNDEVLKIIRNQKLLNCGILVTSRPHSTTDVQSFFPTVVRVGGFTEEEAKKFVVKFFTDETKIKQIMLFKPSDSRENGPVYKCPILLSLRCLLVKEEEFDLSETNLTIGDLYLRMVQCLYKKFTIRKNLQFEHNEFVTVIKSVGQLALLTLKSNNPLLLKSDVLKTVGNSAFEYGFFAGHENFRLSVNPTADICVTYPHRSLEEFFGSFGFILALDEGKSIDDILGPDCVKPILMTNPLFLEFCLWFLTTNIFKSPIMIFNKLVLFTAERLNFHTLNTSHVELMYPALCIREAFFNKNSLKLNFLKQVLEKCKCVRVLHIGLQTDIDRALSMVRKNQLSNSADEAEGILECMSHSLLSKLTLLSISERSLPTDINSNDFTISIDITEALSSNQIFKLLTKHDLLKRNPQVRVKITCNECDLSTLVQHTNQLHLVGLERQYPIPSISPIFASGEFPHCPQFTHFVAHRFQIDDSVPSTFLKAIRDGKFPELKRIEFKNCKVNDTVEWPEVPEFCLETGTNCDTSQMQNLVLNVTELISPRPLNFDPVMSVKSEKLSVLQLGITAIYYLQCLNNILKQGNMPNLLELSVQRPKPKYKIEIGTFLNDFDLTCTAKLETLRLRGFIFHPQDLGVLSKKLTHIQLCKLSLTYNSCFTGHLSTLLSHIFPRLKILKLKSCQLNSEDMVGLYQANFEGKLPKIEHLDISENDDINIGHLFTDSVQWNQLITLGISDHTILNYESEHLNSLQELHLLFPRNLTPVTRQWSHLKDIQFHGRALHNIVDGVERGMFPALKTMRLKKRVNFKDPDQLLFVFKLYKANIFVQKIT